MPRIRCHYTDCVFLDDGYCGAAAVELDPDLGCQTYSRADDEEVESDWEDEEEIEDWEESDADEEEDDDLWSEDDEEY
jgi:hypothetical protein